MSVDIILRDKLRPMREHGSILLYVHGSLGRTAQDGHLDSHTALSLSTLSLLVLLFTFLKKLRRPPYNKVAILSKQVVGMNVTHYIYIYIVFWFLFYFNMHIYFLIIIVLLSIAAPPVTGDNLLTCYNGEMQGTFKR